MRMQSNENPTTNTSQLTSGEYKDLSRGIGIDMSPEAVTRRLDIVDELREFAEELANAKRLGPVICEAS
jgi:hypothetical protein